MGQKRNVYRNSMGKSAGKRLRKLDESSTIIKKYIKSNGMG
jgi:hypothetical protein